MARLEALAGCWAKIDRAAQHQTAFEAASAVWLETKPYEIRTNFEARTDEYITRLGKAPVVPLELSATIGDAIHNLRSALDHFVYRLPCWRAVKPGHRAPTG